MSKAQAADCLYVKMGRVFSENGPLDFVFLIPNALKEVKNGIFRKNFFVVQYHLQAPTFCCLFRGFSTLRVEVLKDVYWG